MPHAVQGYQNNAKTAEKKLYIYIYTHTIFSL